MKVVVTDGYVVFSGPLRSDVVAYIDADRLPVHGEAEIDVCCVSVHGAADDLGQAALGTMAASVGAVLASLDGSVEVMGDGALARFVRVVTAPRLVGEGSPDVIVDLTGDPAVINDAIRRVADLGTIVLAGESGGRAFDIDFYPDIHVRGLRLIGVSETWNTEAPSPVVSGTWESEPPAEARIGDPAQAGASWYRVSG